MKEGIHPTYHDVKVTCSSCNHTFTTGSTYGKEEMLLDVCYKCHPFYTGSQRIVDTSGRVDKFMNKFKGKYGNAAPAA